jgi:hypothetical protein
VPTTTRRLCVFLTGGGWTSATGMSDGVLLSAHGDNRGALSLWGLLEDDVVGVTFRLDAHTLEAVTGPNWFYLEQNDPKLSTARLESMLLTLKTGGGTREIPLGDST